MNEFATPVDDAIAAELPVLLKERGFEVGPYRQFFSGPSYKCTKDGISIIVALDKPSHWATAEDFRRRMTMIATVNGGSLLKFWSRGSVNSVRRDVIAWLKELNRQRQPADA